MVEKNERKSAGSNELADYLTTKRIEFSYSTGKLGAPRILYVSCDPATLTRDLKTICRSYDIESVRWFNMFPRTARFETLVVLKKKIA